MSSYAYGYGYGYGGYGHLMDMGTTPAMDTAVIFTPRHTGTEATRATASSPHLPQVPS